MVTKRIFLALAITAIMSAVASAQSTGGSAGWGAKGAGKGRAAGAERVESAGAKTRPESSLEGEEGGGDGLRLEGAWRATETFGDGSVFRILFTFGAGKDADNGVVAHSDELFFTAAPSCLTAQGVWKRTGDRNFIATDEGFCFDTNNGFAPAGKVKFKAAIRLNEKGSQFKGTLHIEGFDVDGNLVFSDDATLHGTRMRAEPPPK
jgi:hypothetical protein